jgi:hypothetical protein
MRTILMWLAALILEFVAYGLTDPKIASVIAFGAGMMFIYAWEEPCCGPDD